MPRQSTEEMVPEEVQEEDLEDVQEGVPAVEVLEEVQEEVLEEVQEEVPVVEVLEEVPEGDLEGLPEEAPEVVLEECLEAVLLDALVGVRGEVQ